MQNLDLKSLLVCLVKKCQGNIDATQEVQKINANHETLLRAVRIAFSDDEARDSLWVTYPLLIEQNPTEALALVKNSKDLDASTLSVARCVLANYINRDASTWQKNDNEILDTLLIATPPAEMLTIARIDIGLSELLKRGCEERITEFLAQFIIKHRDEHVRLTLFRRTLMTIRSQSSEVLGRFLTSCLLSGVVPLMRMSYDVIAVLPIEMKLRATPDFKQIGEEQLTLFVFARRAIGWMVTNQDLCVSFVLDCVSKMSKETLKNFESDFYYLVCLNYPDLVKGELKIRRADCRKDYYKRIKKLHGQAEWFWKEKSKMGNCAELKPYASEQREWQEYYRKTMSDSSAAAMNKTAFRKLFTVIQMLHGHGTVMYDIDKEGEVHKATSKMQPHQASVTLPIMSCVCSHSFDAWLYQLRLCGVPR